MFTYIHAERTWSGMGILKPLHQTFTYTAKANYYIAKARSDDFAMILRTLPTFLFALLSLSGRLALSESSSNRKNNIMSFAQNQLPMPTPSPVLTTASFNTLLANLSALKVPVKNEGFILFFSGSTFASSLWLKCCVIHSYSFTLSSTFTHSFLFFPSLLFYAFDFPPLGDLLRWGRK